MQTGFHWIDYLALGLYLTGMLALGFYFTRREHTTSRFFLGDRKMPWWAVGISIFATKLSAITYISIPGRSFETDWSWLVYNFRDSHLRYDRDFLISFPSSGRRRSHPCMNT